MLFYVERSTAADQPPDSINARCPACRHQSTFDVVATDRSIRLAGGGGTVFWGARRCPNPECGLLILVASLNQESWQLYPPETIDFDSSDLPEKVVSALEEAITCHANQCYVASAIMVRKTLEVVCDDRGATGKDLYARLQSLEAKMLMPQAMFDALHALRLLGNDAAHIESKYYNDVGPAEVEAAIAVTKEILKATYQYESILGQLKALKKAP